MSKLGDVVVYTVPAGHETTTLETIAAKVEEIFGSIHHSEMREFAAIVGNVNIDGTCDLQLLVPNKEPRWVDAVPEGTGPGTFAATALTLATVAPADVAEAVAAAELAKNSASSAASSASSASSYASSAGSYASSASSSASSAASSATSAFTSAADAKSTAETVVAAMKSDGAPTPDPANGAGAAAAPTQQATSTAA